MYEFLINLCDPLLVECAANIDASIFLLILEDFELIRCSYLRLNSFRKRITTKARFITETQWRQWLFFFPCYLKSFRSLLHRWIEVNESFALNSKDPERVRRAIKKSSLKRKLAKLNVMKKIIKVIYRLFRHKFVVDLELIHFLSLYWIWHANNNT